MAASRGSARRYAEAAFQLAERDDDVDAWRKGLAYAAAALSSDEVDRVLSNPALPLTERIGVVERIIGDQLSERPLNLVRLLLRRRRLELLPGVAREFARLHDRRLGITEAVVTSAAPLDDQEVAALRDRLAGMTGDRMELSFQVDTSILGGVVVRLGDKLIDGSVRGRLERLRDTLATTAS
ncbi:F0F1 ATP synthase subunit delta [soil metagenome]